MTVEQYIAALEHELRYLPKEEREGAINYYKEYFEEAKEASSDGTYDPCKEFGEPSQLAAQIIQESAQKIVAPENKQTETKKEKKTSFSEVWIIILAILASPIAFPVGIALIAVIISLVIAVVAVSFGFFAAAIATGVAGIVSLVASFFLLVTQGPTGFVVMGVSLTSIGIAILLGILAYLIEKGIVLAIAKTFGKLVRKKEGAA